MFLFKVLDMCYHFVFQKVLTNILTFFFIFYHMNNTGEVGFRAGEDEGCGWKMRYRHEQDLKEDTA